jgi:hypothetical protein
MAKLATVCPGPGRLSETVTPRIYIAGAWKRKKIIPSLLISYHVRVCVKI